MKKTMAFLLLVMISLVGHTQQQELEQLILDVEKLAQFKQILSDMKTGYDILTQGYNAVRDISQGNFNLHKAFLDGLLVVSPTVRNYVKVASIINNQITIVSEYKTAFSRLKSSGYFNPDEINYVAQVYSKLFDDSVNNLSDLTTILMAGSLRMSDAERLQSIDRLDRDMTDKLSFLRSFNNQAAVMTLQRAREQNSLLGIQKMYQTNP